MMSETVDLRTGLIRASGHLTAQGADLLRGTADSLREGGHRRVVLDLAGIREADDAGVAELHSLRDRFAADGAELVLRHATQVTAEPV
ncbi:STAS domain-containing protein [Blastococcus sp. CCUG 61487]|uniref:STAS domain-containing protein n=1 Tax=Blastococcus sp. CCUG 61487 TaxID=1840703 RepID=UPI00201E1546|nr:STAS domain-containing protein [Blastococcus sp. CCUG 61487]